MRTKPRAVQGREMKTAFSRVELLACIGCALVLAVMAAPGFANSRVRSERAICVDNLRRIGQAVQLWGAEHESRTPWRTPLQEGGTRANGKPGNAFYEFAFMSNELVTPKVLMCPSDAARVARTASHWGTTADGGYRNAGYANLATSYTIGLHASLGSADSYVSSDRNLRVDSVNNSCTVGINNAASIATRPTVFAAAWTNAIHGLTGNLLTADGHVLQLSNPGLKDYLKRVQQDDNGTMHLLIP